jgi:hypothetical protein
MLRRFVRGDTQPWEFDDFISVITDDPVLEKCRIELAGLPSSFPPETSSRFVSQTGTDRILEIAEFVEKNPGP